MLMYNRFGRSLHCCRILNVISTYTLSEFSLNLTGNSLKVLNALAILQSYPNKILANDQSFGIIQGVPKVLGTF